MKTKLTGQECARAITDARASTELYAAMHLSNLNPTPRVFDPDTETWRDLTRTEINRGQRYLDREALHRAHLEHKWQAEERDWERAQRRQRVKADTKRLSSASAAMARIATR